MSYQRGPAGAGYNPTLEPINTNASGKTTMTAGSDHQFASPSDAGTPGVEKGRFYCEIGTNGGDIVFNVDGHVPATADAPGFVPADGREFIGPLKSGQVHNLNVFAIEATDVHVYWWREV